MLIEFHLIFDSWKNLNVRMSSQAGLLSTLEKILTAKCVTCYCDILFSHYNNHVRACVQAYLYNFVGI